MKVVVIHLEGRLSNATKVICVSNHLKVSIGKISIRKKQEFPELYH